MPVVSLSFRFRQPFDAPARASYDWCTDFRESDGSLFLERGERAVLRLTADACVLIDTTYPEGRRRQIRQLVRLNPSELAWTNTHLDGPFRHSQYWYRVIPDGPRSSHLEFRGFRLVRTSRSLSSSEVARRTKQEQQKDADYWRRRLAPALARDLSS